MFGLPSLSKLLVLAAIIAAVWFGFKFLAKLDQQRKREAKLRQREAGKSRGARRTPAREDEAEEMVQCPACRAYVPARSPRACGRPDCPY